MRIFRTVRNAAVGCAFTAAAGLLAGCTHPAQPAPPLHTAPVIRSIMTADFPIREAMRTFDSRPHRFALSGVTKQGEHIRVRFTIMPGADTVFEGHNATQSRLSYTVDRDGDVIASAAYTEYSATDSGATLGSAGDRRYITVTSGGLLPIRATYGVTGVYYNADEFADGAKSHLLQTHTARYSIERGDDTTNRHALLCLRYTMSQSPSVETHCFKMDRTGTITDPEIRFETPGLNITLR